MEGQPDAESNKRRRDSQGNWLPAGAGATIMAGTGQSIKNVQGITAAIKVYDGGVVSGDLTLSDGRDWAGTMRHCEDTVATPEFWGQIATYLSLVYKWTEEKHLVADTALGYLKKLFNAARAHFNPVGGRLVGTGKARQFFVDQGLDNSDTQRWWFRLQLNMRRSITERMVRVSSTYCVRDLNLLKLLRFIFCKHTDFTGRQSLALALSFTINKYSGTNVTVIFLPRDRKGSLEILTWWLLGTEWRGA